MSTLGDDAGRHRRTAIGVLASVFLLNMIGRGGGDTYAVFLLPLERDFGWSRSQLTSVYSVYLLVNGFCAPLVGLLFDRLGPRWVYSAGLVSLGLAFFFAGSLESLWQFYFFVGALVGIGVSCTGMVSGSGLLSRWYRTRLSTALGIAYSGFGIGTVLFVPLAQSLVATLDWRNTYRLMGGVLLILAPLVAAFLPWRSYEAGHPALRADARRGDAATGGWTLRSAMRAPMYWALVRAFIFTSIGMFIILVQMVAFFVDAGFSPLVAATAFGFIGMLSAASVMGSGVLADRFGYRQTVTASFIGSATGMALLLVIAGLPSVALLAAFVLVFGLCMGVRGPMISSACAKYFAGPRVATIYGTIYATNALGAAAGSWIGGLLHDVTGGYRTGFAVSLCCIGLAAAPFWTVPALRNFR